MYSFSGRWRMPGATTRERLNSWKKHARTAAYRKQSTHNRSAWSVVTNAVHRGENARAAKFLGRP